MLTQLQRPPPLKTEPRPANQILSALPQDEFERLRPNLREVQLKIGDIVYRPEETIDFVYFVNRGIVSWLATLEDGNTVEAGVIGPEGVAGVPVLLGARSTPNLGLAQSELFASKISSRDLIVEFRRNGELNRLILRFVHSLFTQVAQTAACNRLHTLDQRLARWLLVTHDRLKGDEFTLTQEFLSRMLGVRRAGVSVAANSLRQSGLIDYHRGNIQILDRPGLESVSCECYEIVKQEYNARF
ncbi:MAG: Crp/Fnr family transcriptional regulator [Acidobacteria bacterium]|nr:MAG: Crp/Fnr family transcriptional regulator [Acidobacteriota bacterium]